MKNTIVSIGLCAASLLLGACVDVNDTEVSTKPVANSGATFALAKELASERLRDPEATRFKDEYAAYELSNGDLVVCGTLNGKNAMGGYVGYKPFYIRMRNATIESFILPSGGDEYGIALNSVAEACSQAASGEMNISS